MFLWKIRQNPNMTQTFPKLTNRMSVFRLPCLAATQSGALAGLIMLATLINVTCGWAQPPAGQGSGSFSDRARFTPGSTRIGDPPPLPDPASRLPRPASPLDVRGGVERELARPPLQPADGLIAEMLSRLRMYHTISAKLRQKVTLLDQEMVGTGSYVQQGRGEDLRLRCELKIQVADRNTSVLQVCDGNFLWLLEDLHDKPQLRRIDVIRVRQAVLQDQGSGSPFAQARLAMGGLPKLLESLGTSFQFFVVQQDRLDGVPVWMLRGTWRPTALTATYPKLYKSAAPEADERTLSAKLPPHVPDVVVLFVGRDDLFPYRLEYRRRISKEATDEQGQPIAVEETVPLLLMEWFEVALDTPVDERNFIYRPGDLNYTDGTNKLLESWGLLSTEQE
jgi:hypothetical protein